MFRELECLKYKSRLPKRLQSGFDWVFSQVEQAIILEDNCVPISRSLLIARSCSSVIGIIQRWDHIRL